jgi:hypothetical protein
MKVRLNDGGEPFSLEYIHPRHGPWISVTVVALHYEPGFSHRIDSGILMEEPRGIYLEYRYSDQTRKINVNLGTSGPHMLASITVKPGGIEGTIFTLARKRNLQ